VLHTERSEPRFVTDSSDVAPDGGAVAVHAVPRRTSRLWRAAVAVVGSLLGTFLLVGSVYSYWAWVEHRFLAVTEGQVYRSAAMPPDELVAVVRDHGIRTVIDLRDPKDGEVTAEQAALAAAGVKHVSVPSQQIPSEATVTKVVEVLGDAANRPVLIHCEDGVGRAVLFSALYRIEYEGWSKEDARRAAFWGSGLGRSFLPGGEKARFIEDYDVHTAEHTPQNR